MLKLEFGEPLTALEIRKPAIAACDTVAHEMGWYANFNQPEQRAFDGPSSQRDRKRIGNGKHKNWFIDYQAEPQNFSRPTILGRIALLAPIDPSKMEFGGFSYGKYGEQKPTYKHITVGTPHELGRITWNIPELAPKVVELTEQEFLRQFARVVDYQLPLF